MSNGTYVLDGIFGCAQVAWTWDDPIYLDHVWKTGGHVIGQTSVSFIDERKVRRSRAIGFEAKRKGNRIVSLWATKIRPSAKGAVGSTAELVLR